MITLRDLVRTDRAIAAITDEECRVIADVLTWCVTMCDKFFGAFFVPPRLKEKLLMMRMLAATLSKTPVERSVSLQEEIRNAIREDAKILECLRQDLKQ